MRAKGLFQLPTTVQGHILFRNEYQLSYILSFRQQTDHSNFLGKVDEVGRGQGLK